MTATELPVPESGPREEVRRLDARIQMLAGGRRRDRTPAFPAEEFRAMGEAGLLGLTVPPPLGGRGLSAETAGGTLFELAYRGGTMFGKLALQPEFSSLLGTHGSDEMRSRYWAPMLRGELVVGNQITEPHAGSDVQAIATVARRDGGSYLVSGTKSQAAFAEDAVAALVYARTEGPGTDGRGISAFVIPQRQEGIHRRVVPDYGERWMRRGEVVYEEVRVPADARLGPEGRAFELLRAELSHERALLGAIYLGVAWAAWEEAVRFAGARTAFGKPLAAQQAVAFPLAEDRARLLAAWLLVERGLRRLDARTATEGDAALAKWYAGEVALTVLDHALQVHGGAGYSEELPFAQRYRDLRSARVAHGTDEIMHLVAARELFRPSGRDAPKG